MPVWAASQGVAAGPVSRHVRLACRKGERLETNEEHFFLSFGNNLSSH